MQFIDFLHSNPVSLCVLRLLPLFDFLITLHFKQKLSYEYGNFKSWTVFTCDSSVLDCWILAYNFGESFAV